MMNFVRNTRWLSGSALAVIASAIMGLSSAGCMFNKIRQDRLVLDGFVEVVARVEVRDWSGAALVVSTGRLGDDASEGGIAVTKIRTLDEPGTLRFALAPGDYVLEAFEDTNDNGRRDDGERGVSSEVLEAALGSTLDDIVLTVSSAEPALADQTIDSLEPHPYYAIGDVAPLDDERFSPRHGRLGMWEPNRYVLERRPGVYMLEPYDPSRTPVLFVHGMLGSPREFGALIDALDEGRFQPWVFMYPSGYPLDEIADFLHRIVVALEAKHEFPRLCVVGHSMGGLVTRGFLARYARADQGHRVFGYATLASPFDGVPSAAMGVKMAPEFVSSWQDLAPGSAYLSHLHDRALDDQVEYHLLVAFEGKGASDGVVSVASQMRAEAEAEAEMLRKYRATHGGILEYAPAIAQVMTMVDHCRTNESPLEGSLDPME